MKKHIIIIIYLFIYFFFKILNEIALRYSRSIKD